MWNIRLVEDEPDDPSYDYMGYQMHEKHIAILYDTLEHSERHEDYKVLNRVLEEHITQYINAMPSKTVELYVYNYGIDKAIALLNRYSNKKFINTSSKSLLFAIFYNRFSIFYIPDASDYMLTTTTDYTRYHHSIRMIQQFWRRVLAYRNKQKKCVIENEITYLIGKINKEIVGESTKKVLIYMVNKFRRRLSKTLCF
jgi:nitrate/nitrite-specific signal transduction histidine kinase